MGVRLISDQQFNRKLLIPKHADIFFSSGTDDDEQADTKRIDTRHGNQMPADDHSPAHLRYVHSACPHL